MRKEHSEKTKLLISEALKRSSKRRERALLPEWRSRVIRSQIFDCNCGKKYIKTRGEEQVICLFCIHAKESSHV